MEMYRTWGTYYPIRKYTVVKKTSKQIVFINENGREQREALMSDWNTWHDTMELAKEYLLSVLNRRIEKALRDIENHKEDIAKIEKY